MKLRTKMKVAFIIMAVMPVVLCGVAIAFIMQREVNALRRTYDVSGKYKFYDLYSPSVLLGGITEKNYQKICEDVAADPSVLSDIGYLNELSEELKTKLSYVVVKYDGIITYSTAPYSNAELLKNILPEHALSQNMESGGIYKGGKYECLIKTVTYTDELDHEVSLYIITPMRQVIPEFKKLLTEAFIVIIEVLAFTSFILYFWINRSFVKPIDRLRLGTRNIKEGNLDFEIKSKSKDELGDLCRDFEDMRLRLKRSDDEKEKSDAEEKELIRNISHDLKTPLTAIKGYVEGLRDGIASTPEKQQRYLMTIANKVEDMDRLIDELTLFSRLDTNRIPYDMVRINVKSYFDDCIGEIKLDLSAQDIELNYRFHGDEAMEVEADPNQLKRVINNIISNSIKYKAGDRQCVIDIGVYDEGDYVHISMSDNGKGIAMKDIPRIFERFYRTDESRTSPQSGSGIGLAIVKKIIEDHKGRIWVESVEGEGTSFHINLLRYKEGMQLSLPDNQMSKQSNKRRKS
ncbi:MAG: HAMP domain-containing histidine kinase [Clostridiales bacterium]|nr:HAMP domain-containing histidine kinase [Clostridiales bacterium]MBS5877627.1 HAMP domain-containing histidine kinase [Clostridiales bacterium]MDU0939486.1 HAMP domain-containing sensor histidine kinase [Clostridiales bacterium]MDU1042018.1 HAMP domain-containing sensor histidine kinase [Clostridiales bacterium]MDU3490396.1 HAMP domain-containing sensor histidine kinase [Clostridiales bacterium]